MNNSLDKTNAYYAGKNGYSYTDEQVDRWLQRWFVPYVDLPFNGRVLDLCCGDGVWSLGLIRLNPNLEITGVDVAESAIRCAGSRAGTLGVSKNVHFTKKDLQQKLDFPLRYYDLIFARGLFIFNQHNMMRPATLELLEHWHKLLNDKGVFYSSYG